MAKQTPYSIHPSIAYAQAGMRTIEAKTGKTIAEWEAYIKKNGPKTEKERIQWLKTEFELGTNQASWLTELSYGRGKEFSDAALYLRSAPEYVEKMYSGKKEVLRPIYEKLLKLGLSIGKEAKASPCSTFVPLYRNYVFAQIKPATNTRIDLGLALKDMKAKGRLIDTGGYAKKDRITHRIPVSSLSEIDDEVKKWLKTAYDLDEKK
jgi:hypothetical protein